MWQIQHKSLNYYPLTRNISSETLLYDIKKLGRKIFNNLVNNNIVLIPGLGYESLFSGFTEYTFEGTNIGYAAHCYPGWFNSPVENDESKGYKEFKEGFDKEIGMIAQTHLVIITEMDWAPQKYDSSWGKAITGVAGGKGFGANFMRIAEESEVSWLLFTGAELLAKYDDSLPNGDTFLTDPEACPRPIYRKYLQYLKWQYFFLYHLYLK